ncbi:hypothetical protein SASPL_141065 [Salvia splendens]|uniref:Uncharacterized protein n=1 Tax=Salvia splendens TaxID=180675 RepID=A0A8X8ZD24_SALSN|nr:hypothetical protein SASPL_141065 [Salvia splendens]
MYCRNQQYQPWAIPRTEVVLDAEMPLLQEAQAADPIAAILDRLMTVVSKLETRLDDTDRFVGEFRPPVQPQPDPDPLYNQPPYYGAVMRPLDNHQHDYQQPRNGIQPLRPDYPPPHTDFQHHHNKDPHSWWQNLNLGLYTPDTAQQPPFTGFDSCGVGEISTPPVPGPPLHSATDQLYNLSPWETPGQRALHEYASYDQPPPHPPCCWDPLAQ